MDKSDFLDIVAIVGQYVQLTPHGETHYSGQCPFCLSPDDLILSTEKQYWMCLACGADGDRYDFVARSEKISRAEAILLVGHHTISREPFPHARFKAAAPPPKAAAPEPKPAAKAKPAPSQVAAPQGGAEKGLLAPFLAFRNIIPSYQGAAILDSESKMIVYDSDFPSSTDLAGVGAILAPILAQAGALFSQWGMNAAATATLTLTSENLAILVHKSGPADELVLLVVRLADPSDVPIARRLVASASTKLA